MPPPALGDREVAHITPGRSGPDAGARGRWPGKAGQWLKHARNGRFVSNLSVKRASDDSPQPQPQAGAESVIVARLRAVCCCHHQHPVERLQAVHFREQR